MKYVAYCEELQAFYKKNGQPTTKLELAQVFDSKAELKRANFKGTIRVIPVEIRVIPVELCQPAKCKPLARPAADYDRRIRTP